MLSVADLVADVVRDSLGVSVDDSDCTLVPGRLAEADDEGDTAVEAPGVADPLELCCGLEEVD